jgi:choline dehydrogenase-like flavoprotein
VDRPDVIVVGAGAGGPVVAKELAEQGVKVLVLEAGPWLDPDRDFTRLEDDMGSIVDGRLRWGPADRSKPPWMRRRDGIGLVLQAAGVGGTTLHYNGISPRAYPAAIGPDWPVTYEELVTYYERVEAFLPVRQVQEGELATKDALFAAGCEKVGLTHRDTKDVTTAVWRRCHNAILPVPKMALGQLLRYPDVDGCTMCGHRAAGAQRIHRTNFSRALVTHLMGTMRMGRDPRSSMAGPTGEVHLVEGLFVGDSSILPNGLGGPNPTLTVQALATRTADQILTGLT